MTSKTHQARGARLLLVLAALTMGATQARAAERWLRADRTTIPLPGDATRTIPMWGYAECTPGFASCGAVTVPGPDLVVPAGDASLTVYLQNGLDEPTSIVVPGQTAVMTPVWFEPATGAVASGARPGGNTTARVRSFTHEAPPHGEARYDWPSLRPGTYLYESGTHPQVQVQMGLYGALLHDAVAAAAPARAEAYPGVAYDRSVKILYSEVDRALHEAVASGAYGTTGPTSTFDYQPRYFLVNGAPYASGAPPLATAAGGERVLLRFVNAGLRTHVPLVLGAHMQMIAEDGSPYPWPDHPRLQATAELPAAKTIDAVLVPTNVGPGDARLPILDRRLDVTDAGAPDGGLIAFLAVTPGNAAPVITSTPETNALVGVGWAYQVRATDPNPGDTLAYALGAGAPATMTISPDGGLVQWTPDAAGSYPVTITVTDPGGLSATQPFSIAVLAGNVAPQITSTAPAAGTQGELYSYQATAADPNAGDTQTWSLDAAPAGMTLSSGGLVQWTPTNAQAVTNGGRNTATIRVTDSGGLFGTQTFTVTVANVNDAPTAVNDGPYAWVEGGTLTRTAPGVLANDTDPDGNPLTAIAWAAPIGTLTGNANGSFSWALPMGSAGTRTFTYQARDPGLATSTATVTVNVQANRPPTAADDTFGAPRRTSQNPGSFPRVLQVLGNDSDPDTAIDPTNVVAPATVAIATAPDKGGTVAVNANGTISYTPRLNFRGTETFRYRVRDDRGSPGALSNAATVRVNVQ